MQQIINCNQVTNIHKHVAVWWGFLAKHCVTDKIYKNLH